MSKHIFALYYPYELKADALNKSIDQDIIQRCERVLRLQKGEELILFNHLFYAQATIASLQKKEIIFEIQTTHIIVESSPQITYLLPLQEREQWEEALYKFAVLGVNSIVPVITDYSRASWGSAKDYERARRISIAACEQSKQFKQPIVQSVRKLKDVLQEQSSSYKLCFDAQGQKLNALLPELEQQNTFTIITGPEAGLSETEFKLLEAHGFKKITLTSSILKASHAATLAVGILRSLF